MILDAICDKAIGPFADRMGPTTKPRRQDDVARLALAGQHDLCSQRQRRGSERDRVMAVSCVSSSLEIVSIAFACPVRIDISFIGYAEPMQ
ncbi:hypothetical protein ACF1BQ_032445 [Bradyrhizobium sp. RDT10]